MSRGFGFGCRRGGLRCLQPLLPVRLAAPLGSRAGNRTTAAAASSAGAPHRDGGGGDDVAGLRLFEEEALAGARQAMGDDMKRQLEDTQAKLRDAERKLVVSGCRPCCCHHIRRLVDLAVPSPTAGGEGAGHGAAAVPRGGAQARRDWRVALRQDAAPSYCAGLARPAAVSPAAPGLQLICAASLSIG